MNMTRFKTPFKKTRKEPRKLQNSVTLKHKSKTAVKPIDFQEDSENWVQPSYAQVTAGAPLK